MSLRTLPLLCLGFTMYACADELEDVARGLEVTIEELDGSMGVNGLPVAMSRAIGRDVEMLADRLVRHWRIDSGTESVRALQCCGWTFASRIHAGQSQVAQWRPTASGYELLWSTVPVLDSVPAAPETAVPLPVDCTWGTPIHGQLARRRFIERSARCPRDASAALDLMIRNMSGDGWTWHRVGPLAIEAERGNTQARVVASPEPDGMRAHGSGRSSLVLLESRPAAGVGR